MADSLKKAILWTCTALASIYEAVVAWLLHFGVIDAPFMIVSTIAAVLVAVIGIVIGKPWSWPTQPD